jgi:hypothetical protein
MHIFLKLCLCFEVADAFVYKYSRIRTVEGRSTFVLMCERKGCRRRVGLHLRWPAGTCNFSLTLPFQDFISVCAIISYIKSIFFLISGCFF